MRFAKVVYGKVGYVMVKSVIPTKQRAPHLCYSESSLYTRRVRKRDAKSTWLNDTLTRGREKPFVILSIIVALLAFLATKILTVILIPNAGTIVITTVTITSTTTATITSPTTATITSITTPVGEPIFIRYGDEIELRYSSLGVWRYLTTNYKHKYRWGSKQRMVSHWHCVVGGLERRARGGLMMATE
ncbi:hypothetical protein BC938DRAFT_476551 [Jimgerdemannia flammicorona]|uniref:Uncharacterized protein n=1 Tax=Jimgerdemannia flammicorona TaxID=994334 RepID=A0A433QQE3_9FUNG|nr:hypothetical protein BC938DRAFT_476551 [Jimgerdemannia flammicorona]